MHRISCFKCGAVFSVEGYRIIGLDTIECPNCGENVKLHRLTPKEIYEKIGKEKKMEEKFICKYCGKKGTKLELLHHICKRGIEKHYEDEDDSFLNSLIAVETISGLYGSEQALETHDVPFEGGGGEFSGGGASGDFGDSGSSDSGSSDSGSSDD